MLNLYLLRHGKASRKSNSGEDFDRELNKKGIAQTNQIGFILRESGTKIDEIITSEGTRALQTALIVNHYLRSGLFHEYSELYLAGSDKIVEFLQQNASENSVLYVGHNFGISDITGYLTDDMIQMSTSQLLHIEFPFDDWKMIGKGTGIQKESIVPNVLSF